MTDSNIKEMTRELTLEEQNQITGGTSEENMELARSFGLEGDYSVATLYQLLYSRLGIGGALSDDSDKHNEYINFDTGASYSHERVLEKIGRLKK